MIQDDNNLVLEISRQGNQLLMSIFEKRELASTIRHYSQQPVSFTEINRLCQEIISILNKPGNKVAPEADLINGLRKSGQLLWDQLLTKAVKKRLNATQISDLVLSLTEELIHIPWELLYNGKDFLCLKFNLGRLIRTKEKAGPPQYRDISDKHRILILVNPTNDLKSAYLEGIQIKNQLDKKRKQISVDFKSTYIDTLYVKKNLRDYDIVHFAGHCEYQPQDPQSSGWVLSDGRFTVQDILALGESPPLPILVFSNACQSAKVTGDLIGLDYQAKTYSLASAFLFSGTRLYIGTIRKIEDPVSLTFAREFYTWLISGKPVGECVRLGRLALVKEYGLSAISWVSYLLYGDPNFVLFRPRPKKPTIIERLQRVAFSYKKWLVGVSLAIAIIFLCIYLYMWLPTLNPSTYVLFLKSRKLFAQGRNQEVVLISQRIIQKDPKFLAAYPLLADAYHRLGKRDLALQYYNEYMLYSEKRGDKKNLASVYIGIGWFNQLKGDYAKALGFYNKAIALSKENKDILNEAAGMRRLAEWYTDKEEYDKALELLTRTSEINRERLHIYGHRYNLACDYFDIGLVFINKDDYATAREFYEKSQALFEKLKLDNELSDGYFNIGETYFYEKQYQKALDSYMQGLKIDRVHDNKFNIAGDYIMIGELYLEMDNLIEAERFFNQSVLASKEIDAPVELASAYRNLGLLYKKKGQKDRAREHFRRSLDIYRDIDTSDYQEVKQQLLDLGNSDTP
ncbi:MAG: tetratricopeptide repeat protein [Candidatus Omnitrophica bacterium]|nr:tetratricopeptide repeat protein [Candidatus Omnitrophota bacterium]